MNINTKLRGSAVFCKRNISLIVGTMLVSAASTGFAADFEKFYQIDTDFSYQTNPGFGKSSSDEHDVFALRVKPSVQLKYADELSEYNLDVGFAVYENSNERVLVDYVAPEITADWSRELEFAKIGLEFYYDHKASRAESLLLNGGNADVENITKTGKLRGRADFDFNAKWSLNNNAEYTNVKYSEDVSDLNDYNLMGGESQLVYKNTDRFSTYAAVDYYDLDPKSSGQKDSDVYSLVVGGIYTPSENIKVDFNIGGYDASGRFDDSGVKFFVNGNYTFERYNIYGEAKRQMRAGGNGIFQLEEFFNVGGTYELTETSNVRSSYVRNRIRPDRAVSSFDVVYDNIAFAYERVFEDWKGSVYVNFIGLDLDGDQRRHQVIGLTISYDPFDFKDFRRDPLNF